MTNPFRDGDNVADAVREVMEAKISGGLTVRGGRIYPAAPAETKPGDTFSPGQAEFMINKLNTAQ